MSYGPVIFLPTFTGPSLKEFKIISTFQNRINHTIRLPIESKHIRATIFAASESQVHLLARYPDFAISVWTGHPLIPTSWREVVPRQYVRHLKYNFWTLKCKLSSDGSSLCLVFERLMHNNGWIHRVCFQFCDMITGQRTVMCTIDRVSLQSYSHTSLGWLALLTTEQLRPRQLRSHRLYMITRGEAVLVKSFAFDNEPIPQAMVSYSTLYFYSEPRATLTVYPLESLENPQELTCHDELGTLYESDGQLYSIKTRRYDYIWVVHSVIIDGGVCEFGSKLLKSAMPCWSSCSCRESLFDSTNFYIVFCTDGNLYLSTQCHKPPSLQRLALLSIQKLFGVKREIRYDLPMRLRVAGGDCVSVCDVWEGGITIDEFQQRFRCTRKLF